MRDILFRGKRLDNGEWVEGYLADIITGVQGFEDRAIIVPFGTALAIACDPSTVGQYTGLKDRYGDRIWEGDLVKHGDEVSEVFFDTENSCFDFKASNDPFAVQFFCDYEILGNIHDNPDLLK